jgi:hypothetical protein
MRTWIVLSGIFFSFTVMAVECNITFVKAPCWQDYQVHLDVYHNKDKVVEVDLPNSELWTRKTFECSPSQVFSFKTKYSPAIWQGDENKFFDGQLMHPLPAVAPPSGYIWAFNVCFPSEFVNIPMPLKAQNNCDCDMKSIPPLKNTNVIKN